MIGEKELRLRLQEILTELQTPHPTPQWSNVPDEFWPVHQVAFAEERLRIIVHQLQLKEEHKKKSAEERMKLRIKAKKLALAKKYRNTVCSGCYYNRYNFESIGTPREAPTSGEGCWFLTSIKRGKCLQWHDANGYRHGK